MYGDPMTRLQEAIDNEDTYRRKTKRVALKIAKCAARGTDDDLIIAIQLLPLLQKRLEFESVRMQGRLFKRYG